MTGEFDAGGQHFLCMGGAGLVLRMSLGGDVLGAALLDGILDEDVPRAIVAEPDSGVVIAGQGFVAHLGPDLTIEKTRTVNVDLQDVALGAPGRLLVTGYVNTATGATETASSDVYVGELDEELATVHESLLGGGASVVRDGTGVAQALGGGPLVFGFGDGTGGLGGTLPEGQIASPFLLTLDAAWTPSATLVPVAQAYTNASFRTGRVVQASSGGVVVAGTTYDMLGIRSFVTRLDGGAPTWTRTYDQASGAVVAAAPDGSLWVSAEGGDAPWFIERLDDAP